ncbi:TonB family protein [Mariniphaga sp.]|uniref:TonB family protein n=1 Tax=Mariniphaga sp. TaxID=1954475 RepID=UPI00356A2610
MKTKIFILAVLILPIAAMGQIFHKNVDISEVKVTPPVFAGVEIVPDEPDSQDNFLAKYLAEYFQYPAHAKQCGDQGTGIVQFVVQPDGRLTDFHVINSVCRELDKEFIRVIKTTEGMWKPGSNNGNPVQMEKEVSMMFVADCEWCNNKPREYFMKQAKAYFAKANALFLEKHNLKKALRNYNLTVKYLPYDESALLLRGLCRYENGNMEEARTDWERINKIGGSFDASPYLEELTSLKGYNEMMATLEK